jgi:hypothetical protein
MWCLIKRIKMIFSIKDLTDMVGRRIRIKTKVSVTMLNNFFECPWKWYFRNLLAITRFDVGESGIRKCGTRQYRANFERQ